nr:MAG TPA: tail completion protein [Caudoviricetes sp.]
MTAENVTKMLEEMKLPFAYHHFAEGESPDPPFLVYLYPGADNFAADGVTYFKVNKLHIELYTDYKDIDLEEKVEAVLIRHGLFYDKSEVWISSEKLYEVLYQMEV